MSIVLQKRLKTPRKTCVITINRIWHELSRGHDRDGIEANHFGTLLSEKHPDWTKDEWMSKLEGARDDGLLTYSMKESGEMFVGLPRPNVHGHKFGDRDWYCFVCHKKGDVVRCASCPKSFHRDCLPINLKPVTFGVMNYPCENCSMITSKPSMEKIPGTKKVNEIIALIVTEVREWKDGMLQNVNNWPRMLFMDDSAIWRNDYLLYAPLDVTVMQNKAVQGGYSCLEEFHKDCKMLVHNMGVFFGQLMINAPSIGSNFLRRIEDEMLLSILCHECFLRWKKNEDEWWICKPCAIPHEAVWADAPGYPEPVKWPAKVMERSDGHCWVAYFGRSIYHLMYLPENHVYPITTEVNPERMTDEWKKAVVNLRKFQELGASEFL